MKRIIFLTLLTGLGCSHNTAEPAPTQPNLRRSHSALGEVTQTDSSTSLLSQADTTVDAPVDLLMISEPDFLTSLSQQGYVSAPTKATQAAAAFSSRSNGETALGLLATRYPGQTFTGSLFAVVRDPSSVNGETVEATDFYIAAVSLTGTASWIGRKVKLALHGPETPLHCGANRGCAPVSSDGNAPRNTQQLSTSAKELGTTGPLPNLVFNAERPPTDPPAPILLQLFSSVSQQPTTFACFGNVESNQCNALTHSADDRFSARTESMALQHGAILIGEKDFLAALSSNSSQATEDVIRYALQIGAFANGRSAIGATGQIGPTGDVPFSGDLFIVARDARLNENRVEATSFYIAPVRLSGVGTWVGTNPELAFTGKPPLPTPSRCGVVASPVPEDPLDFCPRCLPDGFELTDSPGVGSHRWSLGRARITVRIPQAPFPYARVAVLACANIDEAMQNEAKDVSACFLVPEVCNGLDDNCDGNIDENEICARRDTSCVCQPATCQSQSVTCGTAPDGCGAVLSCGPTCPPY